MNGREDANLLPSAVDAEGALVGAMLQNADEVVHLVRSVFKLGPEWFFEPKYRLMCGAVFEMVEAGRGVDLRTVSQWMADRIEDGSSLLEQAGGALEVERTADLCMTVAHARHYAEIVRDKHIRRGLIAAASQIATAANRDAADGTEQAKLAPELMAEVWGGETDERAKAAEVAAVKADVDARTERVLKDKTSTLIGLPTGLQWLDTITNGYQPGLYFIGARPSAGKTTLEGMSMERISNDVGPVLRCTNDSTRQSLMLRDASRLSEVSLPKILSGHCGQEQRSRFYRELDRVSAWKQDFIVGENDLRSLCSQIRTGRRRRGYKAISIDYVQTLRTGNPRVDAVGNERMTHAAIRLKHLAFDLGVPVIVLSQLSRDCERENREPRSSDLRDGGELEQAADAILMLWRTPNVAPQAISLEEGGWGERKAVQMELVKYKNGFTGAREFWLYGHYFRFEPAAPSWLPPDGQPQEQPQQDKRGRGRVKAPKFDVPPAPAAADQGALYGRGDAV